MQLFENETGLIESNGGKVVLTEKRIRHQLTNRSFNTIMLDKVSSVDVVYKRNFWIFILGGIVTAIISVFTVVTGEIGGAEYVFLCVGLGVLCGAIFLLKRKHTITISSDGGTSISIDARGMKQADIENFVFRLEEAAMKCKGL